jgi:hypothetical protein
VDEFIPYKTLNTMRSLLLSFLSILSILTTAPLAYAQISVKCISPNTCDEVLVAGSAPEVIDAPVTSFKLISTLDGSDGTKSYDVVISSGGAPVALIEVTPFKNDGREHIISAPPALTDLRDKEITIKDGADEIQSFKFITSPAGEGAAGGFNIPRESVEEFLLARYRGALRSTRYGLIVNANSAYRGSNYIHLFFDQNGNSIISTTPQGISNYQYVVHIVYLTPENSPGLIRYSVDQKKGNFEDGLVFNNANQISSFNLQGASREAPAIKYIWAENEFLLRTSSNDIEFDIIRTATKSLETVSIESNIVKTHSIAMSRVYNGTFEIGFINSKLEDPSYELVTLDPNTGATTVKKTDAGDRGMVTAMAVLYTSPIVLLRKLFGGNVPDYQLTGRNLLNDHKIYERIYPTVGIKLGDKAFQNIFFGATWEFARGGSVFAGWHYGEVNTFEGEDDFNFGSTPITETQFNLRTNREWKTDFAIGLNLDLKLVTNLFGNAAKPQ